MDKTFTKIFKIKFMFEDTIYSKIEQEYFESIIILKKSYRTLSLLKKGLIAKEKNEIDAKHQIFTIYKFIGTIPIWNSSEISRNLSQIDIEKKIFVVGKKLSNKMEMKIPFYNLIDKIDDRWKDINDIINDIDEIKENISNYANKIFNLYFKLAYDETKHEK
jgi:hypothetical protein